MRVFCTYCSAQPTGDGKVEMKVAIVSNFFTPIQTGSCYWARHIAETHQKMGDEVIVITVGREKSPSFSVEDGIKVFRLPLLFRLPRLKFFMNFENFFLMNSRKNRTQLENILREHKIEIVHTSNHLLDAIFLTTKVCKKLKIVNLCTIQGVISHSGSRFYSLLMWLVDRTVIRHAMNKFDAIISLDKDNQDYVDSTYEPQISRLIPLTCLDEEFFSQFPPAEQTAPAGSKDFRLASVGHVTANRNRCELIRAIPALLAAGFNPRLEIVGDVLTEMPVKLVEELKVGEYVTFRGEMKRTEMLKFLSTVDAEAHLFFMPGLGCATLEAMAVGLPVLCYGYEGIYGQVPLKHEQNIVFANPYIQKTVDDALIRLAGDVELRRNIGRGARDLVRQHLTWSKAIEAYQGLYRELLS